MPPDRWALPAQTATAAWRCFEHTVRIASDDPAAATWLARLGSLLGKENAAPAPAPEDTSIAVLSTGEASSWEIEQEGQRLFFSGEEILLRELEWRVTSSWVRFSPLPLVVHAGAVVRNGRVLLLPAGSGAGKTTLTLALRARGWLPLTDDLCALQESAGTLAVLPCQRCCHLSEASRALLAAQGIPLEGPVAQLEGYYRPLCWGACAPVHWIIQPQYQADAAPAITPLFQAEAASLLIESSFAQADRSRRATWMPAIRLAIQAPMVRLTYSALEEAFTAIERITEGAD